MVPKADMSFLLTYCLPFHVFPNLQYFSYPSPIEVSQKKSNKELGEEHIRRIICDIQESGMKSINLPGNSLTDSHFIRMVQAIGERTTDDVRLYFSGNNITSFGVKQLTSVLKSNATITTIDLSFNRINEQCIPYFLQIFETNFTITSLNLFGNPISDESLAKLGGKLERNQKVRLEIKEEMERAEYYIEFLKSTMFLGLPTALNDILFGYCQGELSIEAAKMISRTLYPKVLEKVNERLDRVNSIAKNGNNLGVDKVEASQGAFLAQRLRASQDQFSANEDVDIHNGGFQQERAVLLSENLRNNPTARRKRERGVVAQGNNHRKLGSCIIS